MGKLKKTIRNCVTLDLLGVFKGMSSVNPEVVKNEFSLAFEEALSATRKNLQVLAKGNNSRITNEVDISIEYDDGELLVTGTTKILVEVDEEAEQKKLQEQTTRRLKALKHQKAQIEKEIQQLGG